MKIGFVLDDRLDKPDGVQQYVKLLGGWFVAHGHEVHYLVGNSPNASEPNVHHLSRTMGVKFNKNRMAIPLPASKKRIKELLGREQFDVLHVQMPYSPLLAGRIVSAAGPQTAVIGTFHILPHGRLSSAGTKVLGVMLKRNKKRFDGFLSVSSAAKIFSESHFGITSTVLPNVVDLIKFQTGRPMSRYADKVNIVFLGRLVERKGAPLLLHAYQLMLFNNPELAETTRLIICGGGEERQRLEKHASSIMREVGGEIVFAGFIEELEKPDYLASAQVAVYPSTGGESFGIVLIEAMAARAGIVIAGNNPGYASVFSDMPEVLFDPTDFEEFSHVLKKAICEPDFVKNLHSRQQELVKNFDLQRVGPEIEAFYRQALAKRQHKRDTKSS